MTTINKIAKLFLFKSLILIYIGFSLVTLSNCNRQEYQSTAEYLLKKKNETAQILLNKFDAELFSCNLKSILNKPIVLDSIIVGFVKEDSDYYLKAELLTQCAVKYYAKLKCSEEVRAQYNHTKSNHVFLVSNVKSIDKVNVYVNADSLDGRITEFSLGDSIVLSGECLAVVEI